MKYYSVSTHTHIYIYIILYIYACLFIIGFLTLEIKRDMIYMYIYVTHLL